MRHLYQLDETLRRVEWYGPLTLFDPPCRYGGTVLYDPRMTPTNTITFATTGGDDVHFGFLMQNDHVSDESPVIMKVPMGGRSPRDCNVVVGASLREFLALGCLHGYFGLEELFYNLQDGIATLTSPPEEEDEDSSEADLLAIYRRCFDLSPWTNLEERLAGLQALKSQLEFTSNE